MQKLRVQHWSTLMREKVGNCNHTVPWQHSVSEGWFGTKSAGWRWSSVQAAARTRGVYLGCHLRRNGNLSFISSQNRFSVTPDTEPKAGTEESEQLAGWHWTIATLPVRFLQKSPRTVPLSASESLDLGNTLSELLLTSSLKRKNLWEKLAVATSSRQTVLHDCGCGISAPPGQTFIPLTHERMRFLHVLWGESEKPLPWPFLWLLACKISSSWGGSVMRKWHPRTWLLPSTAFGAHLRAYGWPGRRTQGAGLSLGGEKAERELLCSADVSEEQAT